MYDYSAEMNEMIVFIFALLIGYKNIFESLSLYLSSISISLIACMIVIK